MSPWPLRGNKIAMDNSAQKILGQVANAMTVRLVKKDSITSTGIVRSHSESQWLSTSVITRGKFYDPMLLGFTNNVSNISVDDDPRGVGAGQ